MRKEYSLCKDIFTKKIERIKMNVHNKIRAIRESKKIPQKKMAEELNVSRQTMTAIETMKYNPSLELTLKIAQYFEMPVEEIFQLKEEEK